MAVDLPDRAWRRLQQAAGAALVVLGAVVIAGRLGGMLPLVTLVPGGVPMAFVTAVEFVLLGAGLWALGAGRARAAAGLATAVAALAATALVIYAVAEPLGWQRFIYNPQAPVRSTGRGLDGRMSPNAAVSFVLIGTVLLAMARGWRRPWCMTAGAAVVLTLATMGLLSFAMGLHSVAAWWRYTAMAVHTAAGFLVAAALALAWVARNAREHESVGVRSFPFFSVAAGMLTVLGLTVVVSNEERESAMRAVRNTLELERAVERFIAANARLDTAARNFALTGEERFTQRVAVHRAAVQAAEAELERLSADTPVQRERVAALRLATERSFGDKETQIAARRNGGVAAAVAAQAAESPAVIEALRAGTDGLLAEARRQLEQREAKAWRDERRLRQVLVGGWIAVVGLLGWAFRITIGASRRLREANERLEERVAARTQELARANDEVRAAEMRFRTAIVDSPVPAMLWADNGQILLLNRAWLEMSGYAEGELRTIQDWTRRALGHAPPESMAAFLAERFARTARVHDGLREVRTKDGTRREWDFHTASIGRLPTGERLLVTKAVDVTEQRAAERDLQASEMRYRTLAAELERRVDERTAELSAAQTELAATNRRLRAVLDGNTFGIIATDPAGTIRVFSAGAEAMLGWERAEMVGRRTPAVFHDAAELAARAEELTRELGEPVAPGFGVFVAKANRGEAEEREWTYVRKDGGRVPVMLHVTALRDAGGAIEGYLGIARDITKRRAAIAALAESEARFRQAFDHAGIGMAIVGLDGRCQRVNQALCEILGYAEADLMAKTFQDITHPEDLSADLGYVGELLAGTRRSYQMEKRYFQRDGSTVWVRLTVSLVRDEQGQPLHFVSQIEDRTGRRRAELELRASEERMRLFAEHAPASVAMFDREMRYLVVSAEWMRAYRLEGDIVGRSHYEVFPEIGEGWKAVHRRCLAGAVETAEAELFVRSDGTKQWLRWEVRPWFGVDGTIGGIVMFTADITERKKLEESLAEARDAALEVSRMKSEFLANMSHEIRTPMNAVMGMTGLLADSPLSPEQHEMARAILGGAESLLTIINDILDFSKIEAGKLRLEQAEFDYRRVIEDTVTLLALRAHEKGLELVSEVDPALTNRVLGDGGRVRQVFTNLLGNAIKFTEAGHVQVQVRVVRAAADRLTLRTTVRDTGVGIAPEAQGRLFQPFSQEDGSATRRFGGTGLGLAIARQLMDLMSGTIGFESEQGKGSVFWFESTFTKLGPIAGAAFAPLPENRRVLVVDDTEINRRVTLAQLARFGVAGEAAASGGEALARLAQPGSGPWDAVLLDWQMPGMMGVDLAVELRARPESQALPLVMLSSAGPQVDPAMLTAAGIAAYLTKPVSDAQLHRCLARVLAAPKQAEIRAPAKTGGAVPDGPALRILLVEDNPANQRVAMLLLAKLGHDVVVASNGKLALERLAAGRFDVVLMDCQMPVMDGYEATRRIRAGEVAGVERGVPVIALTAYAMADDRAKCLAAGMNEQLTKPVRAAELRAALERMVPAAQRAGAGAAPGPATAPAAARARPVLDPEVLAQTRSLKGAGGGSLWPELVEIFRTEHATNLARLDGLVADRAAAATAEQAHAHAGNAAMIGALDLRDALRDLEGAATGSRWPEAEAAARRVRAEGARVLAELMRLEQA